MAEDVASYLSHSFGLTNPQETAIREKLGKKFQLALIGERMSLQEALATALVQFTPLAVHLEEEWKLQVIETYFSTAEPNKVFVPRTEMDFEALRRQVSGLEEGMGHLNRFADAVSQGQGQGTDFRGVLEYLRKLEGEKSALLQLLQLQQPSEGANPFGVTIKSQCLVADYSGAIRELNSSQQIIYADTLLASLVSAHVDPTRLPPVAEIFNSRLEVDYKEVIRKAIDALPRDQHSIDAFLAATANQFYFRIKLYTLKDNTVSSISLRKDMYFPEYLTAYLFRWEQRVAVLIPTKYLAGVVPIDMEALQADRNLLKNTRAFHRAVFLTKQEVEPPKLDRHEAEKLKLIDTCMSLAQELSRSVVNYAPHLVKRYYEKKAELNLVGLDLMGAKRQLQERARVVSAQDDLGNKGKSALRELARLLEIPEEEQLCNKCSERAADVTLQCGEQFCMWCIWNAVPADFLNAKGQAKVEIPCPNSHPNQITVEILKEMENEKFLKRLTAVEERCRLRFCKSCQQLMHVETFVRLECRHWMCKYCLAKRYDMNLQCPEDNRGVFKADFASETLTDKCEICGIDFYYKYSYPLPCLTTTAEGDFQAFHGPSCDRCLYQKLKRGVCCNHRRFTKADFELHTSQLLLQLDCHEGFASVKELVGHTNCQHLLCKKCDAEHDKQKCWICGTAYDIKPICRACGDPGADLPLSCGHIIHKECVGGLYVESSNHPICPDCHRHIPASEILSVLPADSDLYRSFDDVFGYSFSFTCPHSGQQSYIPGDRSARYIQCPCHGYYYCSSCLKMLQTQMCMCQNSREEVDKMLAEGKEVVQCPHCGKPTEKNSADYLQCECMEYFVPCCAAPATQIYYHGQAWHRPNCEKWAQSQNASLLACCSGVLCPRPKQLLRPRLIGPGERYSK